MQKLLKQFKHGQKGFTLIELLVVVAILGVLAAVAVPNVGKFIGRGKVEARETELHNIQTTTMAMLADSTAGILDGDDGDPATHDIVNDSIIDMSLVTADGTLTLNSYITGLNASHGTKAAGVTYTFYEDSMVDQTFTAP